MQWVVVDGSIPLVAAAFTLVAMLAVIAGIDWQLALVAVTVAPLLFVLTNLCGKRLKKQSKELKQTESLALGVIQEVLSALRVVKAFGQEDREQDRYTGHAGRGLRVKLREVLLTGVFALLVGITTAAGTAAVLYLGVLHVKSARSPRRAAPRARLPRKLYAPMETLSRKVADLQGSLVSAERPLPCSTRRRTWPTGRTPAAGASIGAVEFRGSTSRTLAARLCCTSSFRVPPGPGSDRGADRGRQDHPCQPADAVLRPDAGQCCSTGGPREFRLADVRNQFAIVLQEPVLFFTSIAESIAYAMPGSTPAQVEAAARPANAHEFITALPQGYETAVGERGLRLSGGERQRISLARAFLKDAPILILDEPTSSVDTKTEALIMEALSALMRGRTTFIIAHRLSTLEGCDVRLPLEAGRLTADTHARFATAGSA